MSQEETRLQINDVLDGRYRIVSEGTAQENGTAYPAYDVRHSRLVVILLLARRFGTEPATLDRLVQANQAVVDLVDPNLIPFERIGLIAKHPDKREWVAKRPRADEWVEGSLYLVRQHLEGTSLRDLLAKGGFMDSGAAVEMAIKLCNTLAPAHRAALVHGGLSPRSIVIGADGQMMITDAGLWPALRALRFPYVSPEQLGGLELHPATDVYTIGVLLYEMLTGWPPFTATNETILAMQHLRQEPVPLQTRLPQVSPVLAEIVHRALAKESAARYRNASQLAHILAAQVQLTLPPLARPIQPAERLVVPAPPARPISRPATPPPNRPPTPSPAQLTVSPPGEAATPRPIRPPVPLPGRLPYAVTEQGYYAEEEMAEEQLEESAGSNWLMIGLIVVALIAVLGLVPLWRTVYRRYTVPPSLPSPTPAAYRWSDQSQWPSLPAFDQAMAGSKLDNFGPIWYNLPSEAEDEHQLEEHSRLPARRPGSGCPVVASFSSRRQPGGEITFGGRG